ncbi:RHS repeat-associated core domain-containing protein, partial [Shewanella intestini]|nr:RHS repeat-associated core domain-containing protein [Shewanella intestini]
MSDNQVRLPFQAANKSSYEQNFTYDEVGNLLEKDHNKYRYSSRLQHRDTASRVDYHTRMLMSVGPNALSYDNRGQVLGYGDKHYYWDGFGQSTKVQQGAKYVDFRYAPNGSRSSRFDYRSAHEQVRTYYVDNNIEKTTIINNGSKTEVKFTVYLGSRPVATLSKLGTNAIDVRYHYQDNLNSTTVTADNNGDVTSREIYQAFGKRHHIRNGDSQPTISLIGTQGGRADNKGYTGHEDVQDLSIIHMNGRIYDPDLGRFLSPDPYIGHIYADQNLNRYSYVLNNPMAYTDPSGHDPFAILGLFVTGYEMIDAYQNGGIEAALTVGAENIALNVLTGGLGSVVTLGGKLVVSKA